MKFGPVIAILLCRIGLDMVFGQSLPTFDGDKNLITLSGFGNGGVMAQQFLVAHSSEVHGIASFSDTFYRCGPPNGVIRDWSKECSNTNAGLYNISLVHKDIRDYATAKQIDPPSSMRNRRLYIYAGLRNHKFSVMQELSTLKVFERYIRNVNRIYTHVQDSEILIPTNNKNGSPCNRPANENYYIGNCGFSGPYEAINFLLGSDALILKPAPVLGQDWENVKNRLTAFDQTEFTKGLINVNMDKTGYFFVPQKCLKYFQCMVHVFFHGCASGREFIGTEQITNSGYLQVADANDIIMLFPQTISSSKSKSGCWDTFGISGPLYATKLGPQMIAVKRMIDKIGGFSQGLKKTEL